MSYLQNVTPESVGISSEGILNFLESVKEKGIELHSLMVLRHGKCAAAGWWAPYHAEQMHHLYSFSKSLTAAAVGFAEKEGLLKLDEKLVDIFPELVPENPSENLLMVTIHDLLIMGCGQETELDTDSADWLKEFMAHPFLHKPGTFYKYNTLGTNVLCAIVEKKSGEDLISYLKPRLLDPLGIDQIFCYRMADGTCHGGGGMKMTTEGMARFAQFMLQKGVWEGKELLPGWYERAGSKQIETAGDSEGHVKEWAKGYGYQCWMCSLPQSFRADGAYGQFGLVYPTLDAVIVMTAATEQTQSLLDSLNEILLPAFTEDGEALPVLESTKVLQKVLTDKLASLEIPPMAGDANPVMEDFMKDKVYRALGPCSSMEYLIGGAGLLDVEEANLEEMYFTFEEDTILWHVKEDGKEKTIRAAMDHRFETAIVDGHPYAASAKWRSFRVLEMEVRRMDGISGSRMLFRFEGEKLRVDSDETLIACGTLGMFRKIIPEFHR